MKRLTADQQGSGALCFSHSAALSWRNVPYWEEGGTYISHAPKGVQCGGVIFPQVTWGFGFEATEAAACQQVLTALVISIDKPMPFKRHVVSAAISTE